MVHHIAHPADINVDAAVIARVRPLVKNLMRMGIATVLHRVMVGMSRGIVITSRLVTVGPKINQNASHEQTL